MRHISSVQHHLEHLSATAQFGTFLLYSTIWHISPLQHNWHISPLEHHLANLSYTAPFGTSLRYSAIWYISLLQHNSAHLSSTASLGTSLLYSTIPHFPLTQTFHTADVSTGYIGYCARLIHVGIAGSHVSSASRLLKNVPANLLRAS